MFENSVLSLYCVNIKLIIDINGIMDNFEEFLKENQRISEKKIPFYLRWIKLYLDFCKKIDLNENTNTSLQQFLNELGKRNEEWQVLQAQDAIRLYNYFQSKIQNNFNKNENQSSEIWKKVEDDTIHALRLRHRSLRTEKSYIGWLKRFYIFLNFKNPTTINLNDLRDFLSYLAVEKKVSKPTQRQAFNAILFIFRYILEKEINGLDDDVRSRIPRRLPVVLSRQEVFRIIECLQGVHKLIASIIYGGGLRFKNA